MTKIVHNSGVPIFTPSSDVKTTLIHHPQRGQIPWWRRATICVIGGASNEERLSLIADQAIDIARTGYTALEVRQELSDDPAVDACKLQTFIAKIHRTGVKVIVSISQQVSSHPVDDSAHSFRQASSRFVVQARQALKAGADGIDLGDIEDSSHCNDSRWRGHGIGVPMSVERFSQFVRILQSELADFDTGRILCAQTAIQPRIALQYHLEEDWFHHLRDDSLTAPAWDAQIIRENVCENIGLRAPLGNVPAWSWDTSNGHDNSCHYDDDYSGGDHVSHRPSTACRDRESALALYALSLPGSIYVPCNHDTITRVGQTPDSPLTAHTYHHLTQNRSHMITSALRIRDERGMASGALAFVDNLSWAHPGVTVQLSSGVMVVFNTSDSAVRVPNEYRLIIDSQATLDSEPGFTSVPPDSTAWFEAYSSASKR